MAVCCLIGGGCFIIPIGYVHCVRDVIHKKEGLDIVCFAYESGPTSVPTVRMI